MAVSGRFQGVAAGLAALFVVVAVAPNPPAAHAQTERRTYPNEAHFLSLVPFYEGEYEAASRGFRTAAQSGFRSINRWIDSICYFTMLGECYYHMGDLPRAMEQYEAALELYVANRQWMVRVNFTESIGPSNSSVRSTLRWARSTRQSRLGHFPEKTLSTQGRFDNQNVIRQGGVVQPPQIVPLRVQEIVRCTCLAMYRRREILGPVCAHSPFTDRLVQAASARSGPPNHWSGAWLEATLGMALASADKPNEAMAHLQRSLLIAGQYDHPLTGLALLQMGKLALEQGQHQQAATLLLEATLAAAPFDQADVMEDAFRYGLVTHLASGQPGPYQPLVPAASWAKTRRFRHLEATLAVLAAESHAALGDAARAGALLDQARRLMGRRDMVRGDVGAQLEYQTALVHYQRGKLAPGDAALAAVVGYQRKSSRRLFQIGLADQLYLNRSVTERTASMLFERLLSDPTPADWTSDPVEALSVLLVPHETALEHWFEVAVKRKEPEKAMEVADLLRRHRWLTTLPLGGRLMALRWVLEAPPELIGQQAVLRRQDLLARYPKYAELAGQATLTQQELTRLAQQPVDDRTLRQRATLLERLGETAAAQEIVLRQIALRREPAPIAFPPVPSAKSIQEGLDEGQLVLTFLSTDRYLYAIMFSHDKYAHWQVASPKKVSLLLTRMLKAMGNHDANQALSRAKLVDPSWKAPAAELVDELIVANNHGFWNRFDELIVVPDGLLWYLPFEALQVPDGDATAPLLSKMRVRYAPTAALSVPDGRPQRRLDRTVGVLGQLYPRDSAEVAQQAWDDIRRVAPGARILDIPKQGGSALLAPTWDRLVVLDDLPQPAPPLLTWSPLATDTPGGRLEDWLALPWGGPEQIVLPGFHTAAEGAIKGKQTGRDVFLVACSLMANGARTVLLSRWRTGGQTNYDLVRELLQELPHEPASAAWRRAAQLTMRTELDAYVEPRVQLAANDDPVRAESPLFWAGHLLIDTGVVPGGDDEPAEPAD